MLRLFNVPASILPEVRDTAADYGACAPEHVRGRRPYPRARRRSAERPHRPGLRRARHGQGDLRHRRLSAPQHGRDADGLAQPPADDRRLPVAGRARLRPRGLDLLGGRDGAVAARRPEDYRDRGRIGRTRGGLRPGAGRLLRSRLRGARGAALEFGGAGASHRRHSRGRRARRSPAPRSRASATRRATSSRRCDPTRAAARSTSFASTAGWRRATGRCSSSPTSWPSRSTVRRVWNRPRRGRLSPPAGRRGSIPDPEFVRGKAPKGSPLRAADGRGEARPALSGMAGRGAEGALGSVWLRVADPRSTVTICAPRTPSRATTGRHWRPKQGETAEGRAILPELIAKTPLFSVASKNTDPRRRQNNRENNRTITGAYQGDNRRRNRSRRPPTRAPGTTAHV